MQYNSSGGGNGYTWPVAAALAVTRLLICQSVLLLRGEWRSFVIVGVMQFMLPYMNVVAAYSGLRGM
jgi:hypothetical protein